ncbi:CHAP domain-containing protein [Chryseobacterium sp. PS-8]|uniref:CHAP domain-containing protein n=1 Tax=Chryseobacterium indicum TaxID=2766954 RepID=A0ABS9C5Z6_9FLAO|nr:peptidoglycan-binding protein [Chryseobacterium sp. PS-8]MCF2219896.1 CHAP domain-containing protein [Chryseobacterium sp. PS-8]
MKKNQYLKELSITNTQKRNGSNNKKSDVEKIQSWLCLQEMAHPGIGTMTAIDGDFGNATETAVNHFQKFIGATQNGILDQQVFSELCKKVKVAFENVLPNSTIRKTIIDVAQNHVKQNPSELVIRNQSNSGPWVRTYMNGNEGINWFWCMGFVQTILDQAFSLHQKNIFDIMPLTFSCDTVGMKAIEKNALIRNKEIQKNPELVKPGDVVLIRKSQYDWIHTAIVIEVGTDTFTTIEGNTDINGSSNGTGVFKRVRNFRKNTLDVFSLSQWIG